MFMSCLKNGVALEYCLLKKKNEKWLDFVCGCRKGQPLNAEYDIVIGNVADDDVFKNRRYVF